MNKSGWLAISDRSYVNYCDLWRSIWERQRNITMQSIHGPTDESSDQRWAQRRHGKGRNDHKHDHEPRHLQWTNRLVTTNVPRLYKPIERWFVAHVPTGMSNGWSYDEHDQCNTTIEHESNGMKCTWTTRCNDHDATRTTTILNHWRWCSSRPTMEHDHEGARSWTFRVIDHERAEMDL